ncbi:deoxynucleoside kinase [Candidatus Woesearchaeota archaeon]|nr:deoxynucleoside kinase [Candidatus Woesearchaeota archaeon]
MKGTFIMIDGLDGSGKGTVATALREYLLSQNKKVFDMREYWKETNNIPEFEEIKDSDIIISSEPTFSMIGKVIREEIIRDNGRKYSGLTTAHAFSLDREILYRKLIIPALEAGKTVIQERGVITSLVYQPIQLEKITLMDILNLPGNKLTLKYAPTLLVITKVDPLVVIQRLKQRQDKKDHAIFETLDFQRKLAERYESTWLKQLFESKGSKVVYLDTNAPATVEDTREKAVNLFKTFCSA